jgi:hypothetical protein
MLPKTEVTCRCGKVHLELQGDPLLAVECQCDSCRKAAVQLEAISGTSPATPDTGGTPFVLYRKDRVSFGAGAHELRSYRLTAASKTRRVVSACCGTPLFLEFQGGHWLSLYAGLWPPGIRPAPAMRTMVSDLPAGQVLPADIPNHKTQSAGFFFALLTAWAAMGFRSPKIDVASEVVWSQAT